MRTITVITLLLLSASPARPQWAPGPWGQPYYYPAPETAPAPSARPRRAVRAAHGSSRIAERNAIHERVVGFCRRYPGDGACPK